MTTRINKQSNPHSQFNEVLWWNSDRRVVGVAANRACKRVASAGVKPVYVQSQDRTMKLPYNRFNPSKVSFSALDPLSDLEHNVLVGMINIWDIISFREYRDTIPKDNNDARIYLKSLISGMLTSDSVCGFGAIKPSTSVRAAARMYAELYIDGLFANGRIGRTEAEVCEELAANWSVDRVTTHYTPGRVKEPQYGMEV